MNFDGTVHLGDVLVMIGGVAAFVKLYGDFRVVKVQVAALWQNFMEKQKS